MDSPMIILSIFLAVVVVGCVAGIAWLTRREEKEIPRPGTDEQFGQWLGDGDRRRTLDPRTWKPYREDRR